MRVFIAGLYTSNANIGSRLYNEVMNEKERSVLHSMRDLLESYHYINKQIAVERIRDVGTRVFLDSGAFSAFTLGKVIDLPAYCKYIHDNADIIEFASVLDGIGDPLKTWQNQVEMERLGAKPLPCFHWGEDERYLEHYVANYEYITLGGMVPHSSEENREWLDHVWKNYLTTPDGHAKCKVHGFGMTSPSLMQRYPWYSVDSSSWVQMAFRGAVWTPEWGTLHVSSTSPARKVEGQHVDNFTQPIKEAVVQKLADRGYDYERLATIYISRWVFNIESFILLGLEMAKKDPRFIPEQISIF